MGIASLYCTPSRTTSMVAIIPRQEPLLQKLALNDKQIHL